MARQWSGKRMFWTITTTVLVTLVVVMLVLTFSRSEKKLSTKVEHRYALADPQFRRELGKPPAPWFCPLAPRARS